MSGHYELLGLPPGICTQSQVEQAFKHKARPFVDHDWESMDFEERQTLTDLLDALEALGSGTTVQLSYLQFVSKATIHGFAPVDANHIYSSTFDTDNPAHTTLMQAPCTTHNINDMLRLSLSFNAYRMLGHRLQRSCRDEDIHNHYEQLSASLLQLVKSKHARDSAQMLEHMPANANIAFYEARRENAEQAFKLLSTHLSLIHI